MRKFERTDSSFSHNGFSVSVTVFNKSDVAQILIDKANIATFFHHHIIETSEQKTRTLKVRRTQTELFRRSV